MAHSSSSLTPLASRVVGALLGLHAGDSLGATVEFDSHAHIKSRYPHGLRDIVGGGPFSWPAGHATDDTDLTRAVVLAYRDLKPGQDVAVLAGNYFLAWYTGWSWPGREPDSRPEDIGFATEEGIERFARTQDPEKAGAGEGNAGNGSLMRCLPTGLFQQDLEKLVDESMRISRITHDDERCTVSCAAYNRIVYALIRGVSPQEAVREAEHLAERLEGGGADGGGLVVEAIRLGKRVSLSQMAEDGPSEKDMAHGCSGYVLETLALGIAAVLDERALEDVLVDVVRVGKDTDTNAAVAGGLLGARDGVEAIPGRWREKLQFREEFTSIGLALTNG